MSTIWSDEAGSESAPLIALIHGTMDRSASMLRLSRRLDDRFRVLRYDRRGYGRSAPHAPPFDMAAQVSDLESLLHGRRAIVFGHSYGGNVALATADGAPQLVAAVGVYEMPQSWEPWWPSTTAGAAAQATLGTPADAAERFMRRLVGDSTWESLPAPTRDTRRAEGEAMVAELRDLAASRPWRAARIHCPVIMGYGSRGAAHHVDGMQRLHEVFEGSQLFVLPDCRHDAPSSQSALVAETMIEALARAAGSPWSDALSQTAAAPCQP